MISFVNRLAIPDAILIVVPEFFASILGTVLSVFMGFLTIIDVFVSSISAPKFLHASTAAIEGPFPETDAPYAPFSSKFMIIFGSEFNVAAVANPFIFIAFQ